MPFPCQLLFFGDTQLGYNLFIDGFDLLLDFFSLLGVLHCFDNRFSWIEGGVDLLYKTDVYTFNRFAS